MHLQDSYLDFSRARSAHRGTVHSSGRFRAARGTVHDTPDSPLGAFMTAKPNLTLITPPRPLPADHVERNPGMPLDLDVVRSIRVNRSAVERRAATMGTRRTV